MLLAPERTPVDGRVAATTPTATPSPTATHRLRALDALRGLAVVIMLLVMNPGPTADLPDQLHHAEWNGMTIADLAFPLFLFAVGLSMTLSTRGLDLRHALRRTAVLAGLGVALASLKHQGFYVTGVLQHIAGAYLLAVLVLRAPRRYHVPIAVGMVVAQIVGFTLWALPSGADPWGDTGTLAHAVDGWVLGRLSSEGVLATAASAVTVLGGAFAGRAVRTAEGECRTPLRTLATTAVGLLCIGALLTTVVPLNKHLWTPSYTVVTLGVAYALLAGAVWLIDVRRIDRPAVPLTHLGTNPTLVYLLSMAVLFTLRNTDATLASPLVLAGSEMLGAMVCAVAWIGAWWLLALVLHRRQVVVKI